MQFLLPLNISSLRIIQTATNYQEIIQTITLFDNVLNGNIDDDDNICSEWLSILNYLIVERTENKFDSGFLCLIFGGRGLEKHKDDDYVPDNDDDDMTKF